MQRGKTIVPVLGAASTGVDFRIARRTANFLSAAIVTPSWWCVGAAALAASGAGARLAWLLD